MARMSKKNYSVLFSRQTESAHIVPCAFNFRHTIFHRAFVIFNVAKEKRKLRRDQKVKKKSFYGHCSTDLTRYEISLALSRESCYENTPPKKSIILLIDNFLFVCGHVFIINLMIIKRY